MSESQARYGSAGVYSERLSGANEVAILVAASHDAAAEALLRSAIDDPGRSPDPRLWHMLFELFVLGARREAFDALALQYRVVFGVGPPAWGPPQALDLPGAYVLRGVLAPRPGELDHQIAQFMRGRKSLVLDMGEVERIEYASLHTFQALLGRLGLAGVRVILANVSEVAATLLEALGADRHALLMRRKGGAATLQVQVELAKAA
jgi:anti-anti-sigma regulatory factor